MRLPPVQAPDGAWLVFEELATDPERSGNWRWALLPDGRWFQQRNTGLYVEWDSDAPDAHYTAPFPDDPVRTFETGHVSAIRAAVGAIDFDAREVRPTAEGEPLWRLSVPHEGDSLVVPRNDGRLKDLMSAVDAAVRASA